jgi:hypothetical protein
MTTNQSIEDVLIALEKELHSSLTRSNQNRLDQLIANDFYEFGSSGNVWTKKDILSRLPQEKSELQIFSRDYQIKELSPGICLVTYVSFRKNGEREERVALRSSIWRKISSEWEMVFHQGTFKPV